MLIENKGIKASNFHIPSFDLNSGEFIVLYLFNGPHFHETAILLKDIFSGRTENKNVLIHKHLTCVEHIIESKFRRLFYPLTVGKYLKKNGNLESPYSTKIYENEWINAKTKVNTLPNYNKQQLSLYTTLSMTNNIIFDISGQGPKEAKETYQIAKEIVNKGGSVLLLDGYNDMKDDCTKYIELRWIKEC